MERTQVVIVRHGQTQWNIRGIRQGHLDSDLTELGVAQAKARQGRHREGDLHAGRAESGVRACQLAEPEQALAAGEPTLDEATAGRLLLNLPPFGGARADRSPPRFAASSGTRSPLV